MPVDLELQPFAKPTVGFAVKSDRRPFSPLYPSYDLFHGIAGLALEFAPDVVATKCLRGLVQFYAFLPHERSTFVHASQAKRSVQEIEDKPSLVEKPNTTPGSSHSKYPGCKFSSTRLKPPFPPATFSGA
jgi:hypothetical protein